MADEKIIFSMNGVGKVLPHNNKVILKDIYLSFFYGAKIGIIGLNGSGKSTLMKIIAGIEKGYQGEVVWAPGYSVGYLEQEPQMDPEKTVLEVVQEGTQEVVDLLKEYEEVNMKFCEPMSDDEMAEHPPEGTGPQSADCIRFHRRQRNHHDSRQRICPCTGYPYRRQQPWL